MITGTYPYVHLSNKSRDITEQGVRISAMSFLVLYNTENTIIEHSNKATTDHSCQPINEAWCSSHSYDILVPHGSLVKIFIHLE